ncbi:unnamed protein product [Clonostachys rosea]|uniref:Uncharacterized protein n=1 Tax=Bionectria ochroleuca TaxID=29856 RepID=A0ABY6UQ56_BIOOC|nr:unnamed protein product [Clonostachys rosea]
MSFITDNKSRTLFVSLGFLADLKRYLTEKPYFLKGTKDRPDDFTLTNILTDLYTNVPVINARGFEDTFLLDTHGFQLFRHSTSMSNDDFDNDDKLEQVYFSEMETFLTTKLKAQSVRVMQSSVRERPEEFENVSHDQRSKTQRGHKLPLTGLHIGSRLNIFVISRNVWTDQHQIRLNKGLIWRPLRSNLRDWPLVLCDARSVAEDDKVEADLIYPGFQGENIFLYFSPHYKLYFLDEQARDEIWLFKQFDSEPGVAQSKAYNSRVMYFTKQS